MPLSSDTAAQIGIAKSLSASYPRMTDEQLEEIVRLLAPQDSTAVVEAIDRHVLGEEGKWPPQAGQILEHVRAIEQEARRQRQPAPLPSGPGRRPADMSLLPEGYRRALVDEHGKPVVPHIWPNDCRDCADTGIGRFYHTVTGRSMVWTAPEALELPDAMMGRLRAAQAICDCEAGIHRPERGMRCARFPGGLEDMPLWPRMENIRAMARRRREHDLAAVGTV